ncbi:MAG: D-alanyl-D-alanine carboxypeptidase family protein [Gammaproteobacteria bacterium]|jgi:D-alanyl-D-alanine carboxypeptidase (penicillin-binding protein 5/6)
MKRTIPGLAVFLAAGSLWAQPAIDAKSYYLVDASSGVVLAEENAAESLDPASLTKLMTAYLAFESLESGEISLAEPVVVSEKAWREPGSRMFIEVNSEVAVDDLLRGLIVQSGNDAAIALAEHIAGSEEAFVERMNAAATALGMSGTVYRNPNGLPARGHFSTAADMATLARALIRDFPEHYSRYSEREFTYNEIRQHNRNALLWLDQSVDGLKTGYTRAAGYCLVSSAERDGMRLIAVVFGASTPDLRTEGSMALLNYGFDAFETHKLYSVGQPIAQARVWKGSLDMLALGATEDVFVTVPRGEYQNLGASAALTTDLVAPLDRNQAVGELEIRLGDERLYQYPLVALEPVGEGWFLSRMTDSISLWLDRD